MILFATDTGKEKPIPKERGETEIVDNIETPKKQNRDHTNSKMTNDITIGRTFKLGVYWEEFIKIKCKARACLFSSIMFLFLF